MVAKKAQIGSKRDLIPNLAKGGRKKTGEPTEKMKAFARERISGKGMKEAAMAAGVGEGSASQMANRWKKDPRLQKYIAEIEAQAICSVTEIEGTLVDMMRFDVLDYLPESPEKERLRATGTTRRLRKAKLITTDHFNTKGVKTHTTQIFEFEGYDKGQNARVLARIKGMDQRAKLNEQDQKYFDSLVADAMVKIDQSGELKTPEERDQYRQQIIDAIVLAKPEAAPYLGRIG